MPRTRIVPIAGQLKDYAWGSRTAMAEFLRTRPTGRPQAELWLGAHESTPSRIDNHSLFDAVAADPCAYLGRKHQASGGSLPYLLKVLAVDQPLSIQVHPSKMQALDGFIRETGADVAPDQRSYKDANHKPEVIYALSEFELLCGFVDDIEFERRSALFGLPSGRARRQLLADVFALGPELLHAAISRVRTVAPSLGLGHLLDIAERYPADPGVVVAALMNHRVLAPGEAMLFRSGVVHAYLKGLGVELLANSDNVVRAGLTPKHVDVAELLNIVSVAHFSPDLIEPTSNATETIWPTAIDDFELRRVRVGSQIVSAPLGSDVGPRIILCTEGSVQLWDNESSTDPCVLTRGRAAWVFPSTSVTVSVGYIEGALGTGSGEVFIARSPLLGNE